MFWSGSSFNLHLIAKDVAKLISLIESIHNNFNDIWTCVTHWHTYHLISVCGNWHFFELINTILFTTGHLLTVTLLANTSSKTKPIHTSRLCSTLCYASIICHLTSPQSRHYVELVCNYWGKLMNNTPPVPYYALSRIFGTIMKLIQKSFMLLFDTRPAPGFMVNTHLELHSKKVTRCLLRVAWLLVGRYFLLGHLHC